MRIRRLTLTLPPRMRGTAQQDARRLAEGLARSLQARGETLPADTLSVTVPSEGRPAAHLETPVARAALAAMSGKPGRR